MNIRPLSGALCALGFLLAACQSVRTQDVAPASVAAPADATAEVAASPSPTAAMTPTPTPGPGARKHSYNRVEGVGRTVALTFDDGPIPKTTPKLLDLLKERGVKATFYVVGRNVAEYPEIARRIVEEGHEIANHTWSHPALTKVGASGIASQIQRTNAAIKEATGVTPTNMRPPYGATNASINRRLNEEFGLAVIMWDVDPLDWKYRNAARVQQHILANAKPGSIILAHDIHPSTVAAMPGTIDGLLAKGFKFVTVSELIAMEGTAAPAPSPAPAATAESAPAATVTVPAEAPAATPFAVDRYATPTP